MRLLRKIGVIVLMAGLVACAAVPIQNVDNAPVTSATGKTLTTTQVRDAIVRAGVSLGWMMKDNGPDKLTGTLLLRTHTAVVDIPYSPASYSIRYVSSENLDAKDGNIHRNYNGWITNLTRAINAQLSAQQ
jgi:hypothetical protein